MAGQASGFRPNRAEVTPFNQTGRNDKLACHPQPRAYNYRQGKRHQQIRPLRALYIDMQLLLSGNNLVKPDRMGMAVSLEARTPFLDYRMMEFAFRMPGHFKLRDGVTKFLFKKAVAPLIGEDLAYRKKQMFTVPVGGWFRNELREYCRDYLGRESHFRKESVFSEYVESLVENHIQVLKITRVRFAR
ncbi:asparagine synthase-related protein [Mesorhizobium sp. A556]